MGGVPSGATLVDLNDDGLRNGLGNASPSDRDNDGVGWDRRTENAGSNESVPKNVAVNFYIKICNCRTGNCR